MEEGDCTVRDSGYMSLFRNKADTSRIQTSKKLESDSGRHVLTADVVE